MDVIVAETKPSKSLRLSSLHKILIEYQFRLWMIQNKRRKLADTEVQKVLASIVIEYELPYETDGDSLTQISSKCSLGLY